MNGIIEAANKQTTTRAPGHFAAVVNGRPWSLTQVTGIACKRAELEGMRTRNIWKIHAVGQVRQRRTVIGFFIDQVLVPGTYDLVRNDRLTAVYHLTPRQVATVYHSRDFQEGSVTLHECDVETGRVRGTFEFAIPAMGFRVSQGEFDLVCLGGDSVARSAD